jgi:hypothetical protein
MRKEGIMGWLAGVGMDFWGLIFERRFREGELA